MMYLIYNEDGSIKLTNLNEVITQGSTTTSLFVYVAGYSPTEYSAIATYILSNNETSAGNGSQSTQYIYDDYYPGWLFTLTQDETYYYGKLLISIKIYRVGTTEVLFTIPVELTINKSGFLADSTNITITQYTNLISTINALQNYVVLDTTLNDESITVDSDTLTLMTRDTAQTITGVKTFENGKLKVSDGTITATFGTNLTYNALSITGSWLFTPVGIYSGEIRPYSTGSYDLGVSSYKWKNLYLSNELKDGTYSVSIANIVDKNTAQTISGIKTFSATIYASNGVYTDTLTGGETDTVFDKTGASFKPSVDNSSSLGNSSNRWKDLYLSGNLSDGSYSVSVDNIVDTVSDQLIYGNKSFFNSLEVGTQSGPKKLKIGSTPRYLEINSGTTDNTPYFYYSAFENIGPATIYLPNKSGTLAVLSDLSSVYKIKGSKTVADINNLGTSASVGDVYNVEDSGTLTQGNVSVLAGDNVVWLGALWDKLASTVDLTNYYTMTQVDTLIANSGQLTITEVDIDE